MATADIETPRAEDEPFVATRNACKLCAPLGACLAFRGIEGAVPFLHGSQGCSTYIRRYMISHFKEPVDIACSNFGEMTAIYGGKDNLRIGLENVVRQYQPQMVGIATTCLSETIGDDVSLFLHEIRREKGSGVFFRNGPQGASQKRLPTPFPAVVHVATPSYAGSHAEGFHATVRAVVDALSVDGPKGDHLNLMPGMVSPADIRYLKEICADFALDTTIVPDYSDTLDGPAWTEYRQMPDGGTPVEHVRRTGCARATIEFGAAWNREQTAGALLEARYGVPRYDLPLPIGTRQTDRFFDTLERVAGSPTPAKHAAERGRLIDALVDAHKHVFGKRAVVYGEADLVVGLVAFLAEIGIVPAVCATGMGTGRLADSIAEAAPDMASEVTVLESVDFADIEEHCAGQELDLVVGNSKGFKLSRKLNVPLIRVGFPVHDRIGGPRLLHLGYRGAQQLFDRIANALIEAEQHSSPVGYTYM